MTERNTAPHDALLDLNEAARRLGLKSHWALRKWCSAHRFPFVRCGTRSIRIRASDVQRFIEANLVPADPRVALDGLPDDAVEGREPDADDDGSDG